MSYEGYDQVLCENGHYHTYDCWEFWKPKGWVCHCGAKAAWSNSVNVTNGSFDGDERIDGYVELEVKDQCKCPTCGHVTERVYKIPEKGGHRVQRN